MMKSTIKVTFSGETKRVQAPSSYQDLLNATLTSFKIMQSSTS